MDREDFMAVVYTELASDPDNNRANRIIEAADGYAERRVDDALQVIEESQSVQLGTNLAEVGTDCISRLAAIDALENDKAELDRIIKGMSANDAKLDRFVAQHNQVVYDIDAIKHLPPAQPKQRTGKWIIITKGAMHEKYMCSACGRTIEEDGIERLVPIKYPFCHCGAKMKGGAE